MLEIIDGLKAAYLLGCLFNRKFRENKLSHQRERPVGGNAMHRCRNLVVAVWTYIIKFVVVCHFLSSINFTGLRPVGG